MLYYYIADLQIILKQKIAMIMADKVTVIFCMADDFCKFFDTMIAKYTQKQSWKECITVQRTLDTQLALFEIRRIHVKIIWY